VKTAFPSRPPASAATPTLPPAGDLECVEIAARCECLKAALELRAANDLPDAVISRARIFESYVLGDNRALLEPGGAASGDGNPTASKGRR